MKTEEKDSSLHIGANELKDRGNKSFGSRKYNDALSCYSKAISTNPSVATYFTNRALCYLKLKQWDNACKDCRRALEIDPGLVKGHFFMGQALLEQSLFDEAITSLKRAQEVGKEQKQGFGDEIASVLRLARKRRWNKIEEKRIQQEIDLQTYLNDLIKADGARKLEEARKAGEEGEDCVGKLAEELDRISLDHGQRLKEVNHLFEQLDDRRKKRDVPDYLCGKISFEVLRDPVITPSGITYDRKDIEEHLLRVGHFDPVTRKELTRDDLIPNFAMKEVVDTFMEENPWVVDY